jgi:hypothetical protein
MKLSSAASAQLRHIIARLSPSLLFESLVKGAVVVGGKLLRLVSQSSGMAVQYFFLFPKAKCL